MNRSYIVFCAVCHARIDTRRIAVQANGQYRCERCQAFADRLTAVREAPAAAPQEA